MIIVIDDERTFALEQPELPGYVEVKYARTSNEGIATIVNAWTDYALRRGNMVDLYLDHDLGGDDTIMPVVDFLYVMGKAHSWEQNQAPCDVEFFIRNIFIHSQNPTAADTIIPVLDRFYHNVQRIPLPELA
jgi:hypothetical protein